jgi:hypothetical protein
VNNSGRGTLCSLTFGQQAILPQLDWSSSGRKQEVTLHY